MVGFSFFSSILACSSPRVPHGGDAPTFPLAGAHAVLPCAACHGPGTPEAQPNTCIDCHSADVPTPDHYPGQDCALCHDEVVWSNVVVGADTGGDADTDTDTDSDTDTDTDVPSFDHTILPDDQLCGDCHEADRKDATHYTSPEPWDCVTCHQNQTTWNDGPNLHPARAPHGQYNNGAETDPSTWVVACVDCHGSAPPIPSGPDFDCSTCHADIFPHYGAASSPGDAANNTCLGCHPGAE